MNRSEFASKRWKLKPWSYIGPTRWELGGYAVFKVNGKWKAESFLGERYPCDLATEEEAKAACEQSLLLAARSWMEEA